MNIRKCNEMETAMAIILIDEMCEKCGFYQDCPEKYKCPPKELIVGMIKKGKMLTKAMEDDYNLVDDNTKE